MSRAALPIAAAALLLAFALVALAIGCGWTAATDARILGGLRMPGLPGDPDLPSAVVAGAAALTWAGTGIVRGPVAGLAASLLAGRRQARAACALLAGWAGESLLVEALKAVAQRARPAPAWRLVHAGSFSFPSGHAAGAMMLYPVVGFFLGRLVGRRAGLAGLAGGVALAIAIGLTRVVLGVHWASDVLAGWLLGGAVAMLAAGGAPAAGLSTATRARLD